ncbi:hypothetical protein E6H26_05900 [Candidatus Bathyarchaeota archaeon]|nr:MAG: hypothetical protein E6H26_05900 [Candidatus Bathyarchaeota archaeon]
MYYGWNIARYSKPQSPGIALIIAAVFMWWGFANNSLAAVTIGGVFAAVGVGLQVLYLRYRYGRQRTDGTK